MFLKLSSSIPSEAAPRWHTTWGTWPAARSADEDRELVGDKLAATAREDERPVDEARAVLLVLLVDTGREASDVQLFGSMPWRMAALPLRTGWRSSKEGGGRRNVAEIA